MISSMKLTIVTSYGTQEQSRSLRTRSWHGLKNCYNLEVGTLLALVVKKKLFLIIFVVGLENKNISWMNSLHARHQGYVDLNQQQTSYGIGAAVEANI